MRRRHQGAAHRPDHRVPPGRSRRRPHRLTRWASTRRFKMPRKSRPGIITLHGSVACGAADASNVILGPDATASVGLVTPFDNLTFLGCVIVQRVAGTGTGTFSV